MTTQTPLVDQSELLQKAERPIPGGCLGMIVLPADLRMVMLRGDHSPGGPEPFSIGQATSGKVG
jgi:hypothetical protein